MEFEFCPVVLFDKEEMFVRLERVIRVCIRIVEPVAGRLQNRHSPRKVALRNEEVEVAALPEGSLLIELDCQGRTF